MDSGNSGSLQSSSGGGDDEFDSRCGGADSSPLSALLRQPSSAPGFGGGSFYGLHQELATPPPPQLSQCWSSTAPHQGAGAGGGASTAPRPSIHGAPPASHAVVDQAAAAAQQQQIEPAAPRGSRKRTRASRRAPTTVLTTDTSNFRAMVQEFTGIPAPPFASSSSRFDHLFPSRSSAGAGLSPYILRPFSHKLQPAAPSSYHPPAFVTAAPSTPAPADIAVATSSAAASTAPNQFSVLGMQDHSGGGGGGNYLSFQQSPIGAQLDGNASRYPVHAIFDAPPAQRLPDPAVFMGQAHGVMTSEGTHNLHPRRRDHGHGGDELSGLVGAASVSGSDGCKAAYSSAAGSASRAAPLLDRNAQTNAGGATTTTTPTVVSTHGMEPWVCTSE